MTKFLSSLAIAFSLIFLPVQKSEAAVGVIAAPAIITVGAIVAATGGVAVVEVLTIEKLCHLGQFDGFFSCFGQFIIGGAIAVVGLVILDGQQNLAFSEVNGSMKHLTGVSAEEIATYNSELDQLNAITQEITEEVAAEPATDAQARFEEMSGLLSPATLKVAGLNGQVLVKSLTK